MADKKTNAEAKAGPAKGAAPASKMDAMRQAVTALGRRALPLNIQRYLKEHFGLDMTRELISKYKSDIRRAEKKKGKRGARTTARITGSPKTSAGRKARAGRRAAAGNGKSNAPDDILKLLADIEATRALVKRVGGPERLRTLIDVVAR